MHNIFEGLVQFHCRKVLGIDRRTSSGATFINQKQLARARTIVASSPSRSKLSSIKVPVLQKLCEENQVSLRILRVGGSERKDRHKKKEFIDALMKIIVSSG